MSPLYCYKCPDPSCAKTTEVLQPQPVAPQCSHCGEPMSRDYRSENVTNNFHPTVDLYAKRAER